MSFRYVLQERQWSRAGAPCPGCATGRRGGAAPPPAAAGAAGGSESAGGGAAAAGTRLRGMAHAERGRDAKNMIMIMISDVHINDIYIYIYLFIPTYS